MMNVLTQEVKAIEANELKRALEEHGFFASDHEAIAVLDEEILEAEAELEKVKDLFQKLKKLVYEDCSITNSDIACLVRRRAILGACELIQVAAMAAKFNMPRADRGEVANIVRCKEYKHRGSFGLGGIDCGSTPDDWFCACGERRTE